MQSHAHSCVLSVTAHGFQLLHSAAAWEKWLWSIRSRCLFGLRVCDDVVDGLCNNHPCHILSDKWAQDSVSMDVNVIIEESGTEWERKRVMSYECMDECEGG